MILKIKSLDEIFNIKNIWDVPDDLDILNSDIFPLKIDLTFCEKLQFIIASLSISGNLWNKELFS